MRRAGSRPAVTGRPATRRAPAASGRRQLLPRFEPIRRRISVRSPVQQRSSGLVAVVNAALRPGDSASDPHRLADRPVLRHRPNTIWTVVAINSAAATARAATAAGRAARRGPSGRAGAPDEGSMRKPTTRLVTRDPELRTRQLRRQATAALARTDEVAGRLRRCAFDVGPVDADEEELRRDEGAVRGDQQQHHHQQQPLRHAGSGGLAPGAQDRRWSQHLTSAQPGTHCADTPVDRTSTAAAGQRRTCERPVMSSATPIRRPPRSPRRRPEDVELEDPPAPSNGDQPPMTGRTSPAPGSSAR